MGFGQQVGSQKDQEIDHQVTNRPTELKAG
jgi:hypothetical protein